MKKTSYELEQEIIEVLSKKRGKKMTLKDRESAFDVYHHDGISYESILKVVYLRNGIIYVDVESLQYCDEWEAEFDLLSSYAKESVAQQLGINTKRTPTMQESYGIICEHYEHLKDSIAEYVKAHADENGVLMLRDKDDAIRPYVITTQEYNRLPDEFTECRCLALRVMNGDVQFCALASTLFDENTQYQSSVLSQEKNHHLWYTLDWDMANPFQYNLERIAYYLTIND